jgi:hypothetical protein
MESWVNPDWPENNLAAIPGSPQTFNGVTFDVRGILQLAGTHENLKYSYPYEAKNIAVELKANALHFLHASCWEPDGGTLVGHYAIHYEDGSVLQVPIIYGDNIRAWSRTPDAPVNLSPDTKIAWRGTNPSLKAHGYDALLYDFRFINPSPHLQISSIDFRAEKTIAAPFLLAITAEPLAP